MGQRMGRGGHHGQWAGVKGVVSDELREHADRVLAMYS